MRRRVLIIVQNLAVPFDRRVWLEAQTLRDDGWTVSVICPRADGTPKRYTHEGIDIHQYRPPPAAEGTLSYAFEFLYCWLATALLTFRVRRQGGFDVIQACNPPDTYWLLARIWRLRGVRFVFDHHDLCPETYASRFDGSARASIVRALHWLERRTMRSADRIVSTNDSYRSIAAERTGVPIERFTVVRTGPGEQILTRAGGIEPYTKQREHLACYLGVMGPQDGVDLLIRAAHHYVHVLGRDDLELMVMGRGDCYEDLRQLVVDLDLDGVVHLPGRVADPFVWGVFEQADLGICPDPLNPLNDVSTMNKTMEYMAFGIPIVAFDLRETRVTAGEAARYVEPNDVAQFAQAMADLLDDPAARASMGGFGRDRVERTLAWSHQAATYRSVYEDLASSSRASHR